MLLTETKTAPGELRHRVLTLALPALGEQVLNYCVGLFDVWLAGRVSTAAVEVGVYTTTVGIAAYVSWLATLIFSLVGTGTTALVARAQGAGDSQQANRFACRSITLAGLLGVAICGFMLGLAPLYATMQQLHGESFRVAVGYLRTDACGQLLYGFCLIGSAALRGMGDMRSPMLILGLVNVVNMVVSSTLATGLGPIEPWGIDGIVGGTVTARVVGGLLMLAALGRGISGLKLRFQFMLPHGEDVRRILRIGAPAGVDGVLTWLGHWLFLMLIARLGDAASGKAYLAAHIIGMQAEALTYLPATAWGYAAATLIGQNLGAGRRKRAKQLGNEAARHAVWVALFGAAIYLCGAELIYTVMTRDEPVRAIGAPALRFLSWYQIPLAVMIVYLYGLRGAGDTRIVLLMNVTGIFLIRLPVAWWLGIHCQLGLIGAWAGMCVDVLCRAIAAGTYFARERWVHTRV
ncbi:MAG: MATE family efflux transporter [Planctomycetaceae bacterium]